MSQKLKGSHGQQSGDFTCHNPVSKWGEQGRASKGSQASPRSRSVGKCVVMRQVWDQARKLSQQQIQLSIICKINQSRWEQEGECTHMSKDRTQVPQPSLKTGGGVPAVPKAGAGNEHPVLWTAHTIHSWQYCFFSLFSLQIWPLMTQWNNSCFWTRHLWTIVWLTVSAGAVFFNYPFSTVEHFQPCCLHLPLCASRGPHSLILILLMKCNFTIIFSLENITL